MAQGSEPVVQYARHAVRCEKIDTAFVPDLIPSVVDN